MAYPAKSPQCPAAGLRQRTGWLSPVITNGFNRATLFGFLAACFLVRIIRLLGKVRVTPVLVALKVFRCRLATQVAVNALVIDVILARNVLRIFVCSVSHKSMYIGAAIWRHPSAMASPFEIIRNYSSWLFVALPGMNFLNPIGVPPEAGRVNTEMARNCCSSREAWVGRRLAANQRAAPALT
jgi:hypothetical protein